MLNILLSVAVYTSVVTLLIGIGIGVLALGGSDDFRVAKACFVVVGFYTAAKVVHVAVRYGDWGTYPLFALAVAGCLWFCIEASGYVDRKREDKIAKEIRTDREAFIIRQLEEFINEERQIARISDGALAGSLAGWGEMFTFRGKVEHFLALHLTEDHVARFQQKGVYALHEMIKELLDGGLILPPKNEVAKLHGEIICQEITSVLNAKDKYYDCFLILQVRLKNDGAPTMTSRWQLDMYWQGVEYPSVRQPVSGYYVKRPTKHADEPQMLFESRPLTEFPNNEEITNANYKIGWLHFSVGTLPLSAIGDFQHLHKDVILKLQAFDSKDRAHLIYEDSSEGLSGCGRIERPKRRERFTDSPIKQIGQ